MFDFSNRSIERAREPCSIDPLDRADAARLDWPAWIGIVIEEQRPGTAQRKVRQENTINDP